ncbi:MFS transporter [Chelatococcus asaccharovorans]|uniref:PPP family 3-phenylpropionic acid transporter n=1 Tax=Chelatococcus asaccharovorans TaxID=28210 RepID=A0A2V3U175_9HYPH|nr:MFS transporter [Chelatococcus asaccharovorans]MBS7707599.1 MFS transporter [Chelatococcus asaccharovorans]PXW55173.1 PPP family 3-phenylpropionic acid transporter [Chelatococcus asaccharovorans]
MMRATGRLSFLYAALFFELGINLPFFPLWLKAQSLDSEAIGIILAAPLLTRVVANPLVGALADRSQRISTALVVCSVAVALGTGVLAFARGFLPILLTVIAIALAQGPLIALTDTVALRNLKEHRSAILRYGRIRLWGSAGFALANLTAGLMLDWLPVSTIVQMLFISAVVTALAAMAVAAMRLPKAVATTVVGADGQPGQPLLLALTIAGAALVQASHAAIYGFSTMHWQSLGFSGGAMGGLWAAGVLSEITFFGLVGYAARSSTGAAVLLAAGAAAATLRWLGMAANLDLAFIFLLQMLHGLTFGATHLSSVFLVARLAPPRMLAQAQTWLAASWAGLMAGLTSLAGYLYGSWGEQIYDLMAAISAAGFLLFLPVVLSLRKRAPLPLAMGGEAAPPV